MTYTEALLYGAIQGVTEYLPISSSAHLILLPKFLGTEDPGLTFDVFLHLGTLMATLIYFWREWAVLFRKLPGGRLADSSGGAGVSWLAIGIATVPALAVGGLTHHWIETTFRSNAWMIASISLGATLLFLCDQFCSRDRALGQLGQGDAFKIGLFQCLALMPGFSRSGSTMMGARFLGFDRQSAAKFSFLISAPVTLAAILFELRHWRELFESSIGVGPLLTAGISSFLFGCVAIAGLLKLLRRFGYLSFAIYRLGLALVIFKVLGV